jgi:hypothetical protein
MAKTSYIELDDPTRVLYFGPLTSGDRFVFPRIRRKSLLLSRSRLKGLTNKTLLPQIAAAWAALDDTAKAAWSTAGAYFNKSGWHYFTAQQSLRLKNGFSGIGLTSIYHQAKVGYINIQSPATSATLAQFHPAMYWISKPVKGKKSMRELVQIQENITLPFTLGVSIKTNLTAAGGSPLARFFAKILYTYQGRNIFHEESFILDLVHDWQILSSVLSEAPGPVISYNLYIELIDVQGELWFDNVKAIHAAQNWARDPYCSGIKTEFTKAFVQVPKNWAPEVLPDGAFYDSIFIE